MALVGLDEPEADTLEALCAESRRALNWNAYCMNYAASETDATVARQWHGAEIPVHLMAIDAQKIGSTSLAINRAGRPSPVWALEAVPNTERAVCVNSQCPAVHKDLAAGLAKQIGLADNPPAVFRRDGGLFRDALVLVETTSGYPVALRAQIDLPRNSRSNKHRAVVVLVLPDVSNAAAWFAAFLRDVHTVDSVRVPHSPPRLATPEAWYTPAERRIADRMTAIESEIAGLERERDVRESELREAGASADANHRRAIWEDGEGLVAAVVDILGELGFDVQEMDAGTPLGQPKREDLRLTHPDCDNWQAIAEVKGYSNGTKTSDARQIREYRDRYIEEEQRPPDLTLWIANPYRSRDPSARPEPDTNVQTAAATIDAVHVSTTDLYRQWALAASGRVEASAIAGALRNATPGLWQPPETA